MGHPDVIAGFHVLPLSLPSHPALPIPATHYLYLGPHQPKNPTPNAARSLFAVNVPFDATELHMKHLFSTQLDLSHGRIEEVQFAANKKRTVNDEPSALPEKAAKSGKKRKRLFDVVPIEDVEGASLPPTWDRDLQVIGGTAVIVFVDRASVDAAFKAVKRAQKHERKIVWGQGIEDKVPALGSASSHNPDQRTIIALTYLGYLNHHKLRYSEKPQLLQSVNTFMTAFAEREKRQVQLQAKRRQVPDEDGFITVTRGARTMPAKQEAAQEQAKKHSEKQKGLDNFYRFQMREKKKAKAGELIRKFEEDKAKVRRLREQRGSFRVSYVIRSRL